jgi:hypothetical protein
MTCTSNSPGTAVPVNGSPSASAEFFATLADPVGASVTISQQPANISTGVGSNATFSVAASGIVAAGTPGPLAYLWQRGSGGTFADIRGATAASLTVSNLAAADNAPNSAFWYRRRARRPRVLSPR